MVEKVETELKRLIHNVKIERNSNNSLSVSADCLCPIDFIGFAGHFPQKPILPAIFQLAAMRISTEMALSASLIPEQYNRAKFKKMIEPEQPFSLQLELVESNGKYQGKGKIYSANRKLISEAEVSYSLPPFD